MKPITGVLAGLAVALFVIPTPTRQDRLITYCPEDVASLDLPEDSAKTTIMGPGGLALTFTEDAKFEVRRATKGLYDFQIAAFENPHGMILWAQDGTAFAINYSSGGAVGTWRVRVFLIDDDIVTDATNAVQPAVEEFKSRHFCEARGNNVKALKWAKDSRHLLLMTEVYPTSDCDPDLGYVEGYVMKVPAGTIAAHLTLDQLKQYSGVCLSSTR